MGINDQRLWFVAAALWGFAEATFFFVVPDLVLTASILFLGVAAAFRFAVVAAAGAVLGGLLMMRWGASDAEAARAFLASVPLIGGDLLARVQTEIAGAWPLNLTFGAVTGAPYKIYAVEAGSAALNPFLFALVSFAARLARFALAIGLAAAGFAVALRFGFDRLRGPGLAAVWVGVYASYGFIRLNAG